MTFSTPGIKAPSGEIDDNELITTLKNLIDERTDLRRKVQDLQETANLAEAANEEMLESTKKFREQLSESLVSIWPLCLIIFAPEPRVRAISVGPLSLF